MARRRSPRATPAHPWTFLPGGRVQCHEHRTITYGGVCRQCVPEPTRPAIREVDAGVQPIPDGVRVEEPYRE